MKFTILWAIFLAAGIVLNSEGEELDTSEIKQMVKQMEASFTQGHIFHVNYLVSDKRTDSYYERRKQLIDLFQKGLAKESNASNGSENDPAIIQRHKTWQDIIKSFTREMTFERECTYLSDYSVDGAGFYMKQVYNFVGISGAKRTLNPTIYVSDGKLMGIFYPKERQAVIQPATERPQVPSDYWTDIAYLFLDRSISAYLESMPSLEMKEEAGKLVISGDEAGEKKETTHVELRIDKESFMPEKLSSVHYNRFGNLDSEVVKTWQYQEFSGIRLPKIVVEQEYDNDLNGKWNLETERTLTINEFTPTAISSKAAFSDLLKQNFSVFDEITGSHYISGDAGSVLDNLSK